MFLSFLVSNMHYEASSLLFFPPLLLLLFYFTLLLRKTHEERNPKYEVLYVCTYLFICYGVVG